MSPSLITHTVALAIGALVVGIGWHLDDRADRAIAETVAVRSQLDDATAALSSSQAQVNDLARARAMTLSAMLAERERADAATAAAQDLRDAIGRDVGTDRDAPTAPVLRDAIKGLQRTATTRQDALFLGRMAPLHILAVTIDGRVQTVREIRGLAACRQAAAVEAVKLSAKPDLNANPRRVSIRCDAAAIGGAA